MCKNKTLLWQLTDKGFGSEINNLLYAINYTDKNNYKLRIESASWNLKINSGWNDYFKSLDTEQSSEDLKFLRRLVVLINKYIGLTKLSYYYENRLGYFKLKTTDKGEKYTLKILLFLFIKNSLFLFKKNNTKLIFEMFDEVRRFNISEKHLSEKDFLIKMNHILLNIWNLQPEILKMVKDMKMEINEDYAVLHIRRGDKVATGEDGYYTENDYMQRLVELKSDIKTIFVMSDDYSVFKSLEKQFPNFKFLTLIDPNEKGHLQSEFNRRTKEQKKINAVNLLAEIEMAKESKIFIGSKNSNIFRLVEYFKLKDCYDISSNEYEYII